MRLILRAAFIVFVLCLGAGHAARAEQAVLFVTDWSNSMTGRAADGSRLYELTPAVIDRFFTSSSAAGKSPNVGLITFGNTGKWTEPADEENCEKDVTLRVGAGTDFASATRLIRQELAVTAPSGFTPINAAIDIASRHGAELIRKGKATSVRLVVITDLKDTCDAKNGYQPLKDYCIQGQELAELVKLSETENQGLVKLEFVVAIGSNTRNLGILAECAGATPLPARTIGEAEKAGDEIAETPPLAPVEVTVFPTLKGGTDTLGRAVDAAGGTLLVLPENTANPVRQNLSEPVRLPVGTVAKLELDVPAGLADAPVDVLFDQSGSVEIPWRLPQVTLEVQGPKGLGVDPAATVIIRDTRSAAEAVLPIAGIATLPLVAGDYEAIVGFSTGGWEKRSFRVERRPEVQSLVFAAKDGSGSALWTALTDDGAGLSSVLSARVATGPSGATYLPFQQEVLLAAPSGPSPILLGLERGNMPVWAGRFDTEGPGWRLTARGGLVWITARADESGIWRLIDTSTEPEQQSEFSGDSFAQPVPPGKYMLFFDGRPVCPEGESFPVRIGQPVDLSSTANWPQGQCDED